MQLRSTAGQKTFQREKKKNSCQKMLSQQSYSTSKKGRISPRLGGKKKKQNYFDGNIKLHFLVNPKENTAPKHDRFL